MAEHQDEEQGNVEILLPGAQTNGQLMFDPSKQDTDEKLTCTDCIHHPLLSDGKTGQVFSFNSEGVLNLNFDLSSMFKKSHHKGRDNRSMLYSPMVTVQGMSIKMHSQSLDTECTSELLGSLSEMMATSAPEEPVRKSLQASTVHCHLTCIEGCIQFVFRFFVIGKPQDASNTERVPKLMDPGCRAVGTLAIGKVVATAGGTVVGEAETSEDSNSEIFRSERQNGLPGLEDEEWSSDARPDDVSNSTADSADGIAHRDADCVHDPAHVSGSEIEAMPSSQHSLGAPAKELAIGTEDKGKVTKCSPPGTYSPAFIQNKQPVVHAALLLFQLICCSIFVWRAWDYDDQQKNCILHSMIRLLVPWVPIVVFWPCCEWFNERVSVIVRIFRLLAMVMAILGLLRPTSVLSGRAPHARGWQVLLEAFAFPLILENAGNCEGLEVAMRAAQIFSQAIQYPLCYQVSFLKTFILGGLEVGLLVLVGTVGQMAAAEAPPPQMALLSFAISCAMVCFVEYLARWGISRRLVQHDQ